MTLRALLCRLSRPLRQQLRWWRTCYGRPVLLAGGLLLATLAGDVRADQSSAGDDGSEYCDSRDVLLQIHAEDLGQRPKVALLFKGTLQEFLVGPDGQWTLLVTRPGGLTCIALLGDGFRVLPDADPATWRHAAYPRPLEGR